jgi:hypothetical protein
MSAAADIVAAPPASMTQTRVTSRLGLAVVLLLWVITWAISHSYRGIFHDASLYTLQALARLTPSSLGQDVFLRFGSQDRYTLFSPMFAGASHLLGTELAAACLTLFLQVALFVGAWFLARTAMPVSLALLGVSVLIAIPGDYGADRIFTCVEQFLTPRMGAEALVLGALAAAMNERRWVAMGLVIAGLLIHPIMAAAGVASLACLYVAIPHPRLGTALLAASIALLVLAAFAMPAGIWGRFDDTWLMLVKDRSPYLFLSHWQLDDWSRAAVTSATLTMGLITLPIRRGRLLCQVVLMTTIGGMALTLFACDLLHLVLFTQLQPWRWQWLGTVTAAILLPEIVRTRWQTGIAGRTMATLLLAAWMFALDEFALVAALVTVGSLAFLRGRTQRELRLIFWGACGMLAIAVVWRVASNLEFTDAHFLDTHIPLWLRRAMSFAHDGSAPMAVIVLGWWLARAARKPFALILLAALAAAGCVALFSQTWALWTVREFPPQLVAQFSPWRERIPPAANVFWAESPLATWLLLNRPSYLSAVQTSGMVFSRDAAIELKRRADVLAPIVPPQSFLSWNGAGPGLELSLQQLQGICHLAVFQFLVTSADLGFAPVSVLSRKSWPVSKGLRLYSCAPRPD